MYNIANKHYNIGAKRGSRRWRGYGSVTRTEAVINGQTFVTPCPAMLLQYRNFLTLPQLYFIIPQIVNFAVQL